MGRSKTYFTSDVHLGLQAFDPQDRERRFVAFLDSINNEETAALYLLGDIWDFWYEWKYTVPKGYVRVFAALDRLMASGVKVYFMPGNHDVWAYSYFRELGMTVLSQPAFINVGGKTVCIGHGDGFDRKDYGYRILHGIFHSRFLQFMFSTFIHPTLAMALGLGWSKSNRLARGEKYQWKGEREPLVEYCNEVCRSRKVDCFVFGHYHVDVNQTLESGARLIVLDSWIEKDSVFCISEEALS